MISTSGCSSSSARLPQRWNEIVPRLDSASSAASSSTTGWSTVPPSLRAAHRADPAGDRLAGVLLVEAVLADAAREPLQHQRPVGEVADEHGGDGVVVRREVGLGDPVGGEQDALGVGDLDGAAAGLVRRHRPDCHARPATARRCGAARTLSAGGCPATPSGPRRPAARRRRAHDVPPVAEVERGRATSAARRHGGAVAVVAGRRPTTAAGVADDDERAAGRDERGGGPQDPVAAEGDAVIAGSTTPRGRTAGRGTTSSRSWRCPRDRLADAGGRRLRAAERERRRGDVDGRHPPTHAAPARWRRRPRRTRGRGRAPGGMSATSATSSSLALPAPAVRPPA